MGLGNSHLGKLAQEGCGYEQLQEEAGAHISGTVGAARGFWMSLRISSKAGLDLQAGSLDSSMSSPLSHL